MKRFLTLCISLGLSVSYSQAQTTNPYFLDPYFVNNGISIGTNPPWGINQMRTYNVKNLAIDSEDRILVAGNQTPLFYPTGFSGGHYALSRMKADGSMDSSFATNGHKVFESGVDGNPILVLDILHVLPGNKLIYGGTSSSSGISKFVVYKLNENGSFDNSFGTNGRSVISLGSAMWHTLDAIGIQNDGKLLLLGNKGDNSTPWVGSISRLNANGALDNSFGTGGLIIPNLGFNSNNVSYHMIKVLSDNSFLVAGTHVEMTATSDIRQDFLAKFDANGNLQTSFGTNGKVILPLLNSEILYFYNQDLEVDNAGNIYINCSTNGGSTGLKSVLMYKLNSNGSFISNFGQNGRLNIPTIHHDNWYRYDAQLQGDKFLFAGMNDTGLNASYVLQRYNLDGTQDLTFASPLNYISDTRNAHDHAYFLGLQSNDKIILGGNGTRDKNATDSIFPVVMRFLERGTEEPPTTDTSTSIVNIKDQDFIKVYPNPTRDLLHIEGIKENCLIQIFDISGKLVLSSNINGTQPIDCSQLPAGTYWLYINTDKSQTTYFHKLVKQ